MKKKQLPFLVFALTCLCACAPSNPSSSEEKTSEESSAISSSEEISSSAPLSKKELYKTRREKSIVADTNYRNGFYLISPESTNQYWERDLDYNGEADTDFYQEAEHKNYWSMCQWWTPYNFKEATYSKIGATHHYENASRILEVNTETSELRMVLDADKEYRERFQNDGKLPSGESWSHFLIQQSFPKELRLHPSEIDADNEGLHVAFDITINNIEYKGSGTPVGSDCAQLLFYLRTINDRPAELSNEEAGSPSSKMWFGVPIFDTRYASIAKYAAGDVGFAGATGSLIYSIPSSPYMGKDKLVYGQTYHVDIDVLDLLKEAFVYGVQNDYLSNNKWKYLQIFYLNFGWEIPGQYKVDSTVKNLDVYVG